MDILVDQYLAAPNLNDFNYHQVDNFDNEFEDYRDGSSSPVHGYYSSSGSGDSPEHRQGDPNDPMLKFVSQMLMEEDDLENKPCMFHDCSALQAAEKSFYDVLNDPKKPLPYYSCDQENDESPFDSFSDANRFGVSNSIVDQENDESPSDSFSDANRFGVSNSIVDQTKFDPSYIQQTYNLLFLDAVHEMDVSLMSLVKQPASSITTSFDFESSLPPNTNKISNLDSEVKDNTSSGFVAVEEEKKGKALLSDSFDKKNHAREDDSGEEERRSRKLLANYEDESVTLEMYDDVLLSRQLNPRLDPEPSSDDALKVETRNKLHQIEQSMGSMRGRSHGGKRSSVKKDVVDLRSLLLQCAQSVTTTTTDSRSTNELLKRIRQHSSPHGDGVERLAHYFANALEARLAGTGTTMYGSFRTRRVSAANVLQAYKMFITSCPFKKVSSICANKTIVKLAAGATRLHIIDFGILYGFQWPCLIQRLSVRSRGPPMLHITGIDLPQSGFREAERVEETGQRLARYCQRFNVPFEYNAIAKKWDTIRLEDFKINKDELLVVNCLDRLSNVSDETVMVDSLTPRDIVLNLIRRLQPALFIFGIASGTYNSPFFVTRFREALFHFSSWFDMFEATVPRESKERALFENEVIGRDALNVIACEGTERIDRPETYKQWHVRTVRAGFKQVPLDKDIQKGLRSKVKLHYHKDFSVDEDKDWVLQAWKGRVGNAISCWVLM